MLNKKKPPTHFTHLIVSFGGSTNCCKQQQHILYVVNNCKSGKQHLKQKKNVLKFHLKTKVFFSQIKIVLCKFCYYLLETVIKLKNFQFHINKLLAKRKLNSFTRKLQTLTTKRLSLNNSISKKEKNKISFA